MLEKEHRIYNSFLAISRSKQNKPFKLRKDFIGFENTADYIYIKRLNTFFGKFPHIDINTYFKAPFEIYKDQPFFDLAFYASQKGIKAYTTYFKTIKQQAPDSPDQIEFIKQSLKFIGNYCIQHNINITQYIEHKKFNNYPWVEHLTKNQISVYILLAFPNLYNIINTIPRDEVELFLGDIYPNLFDLQNKFDKSTDAKRICQTGILKINEYINSEITKNNN